MTSGADDPVASSPASRRIGTWIRGKYRLDGILGEGGMAVVYAATHRNKKRFAVKMLRGDASSVAATRRFLREGYVANTVDHPSAVAVLDDDVADDGSVFLVMELLEGESVENLWFANDCRLSPRLVLTIAHQLMDVLAVAHARNVVHRDIKPGNLFYTRDEKVKVLDFGIARLREANESSPATQTGLAMGTPAFMPPEQARGKVSQIGPHTDIWAAGATMFSLLSGRYVHEGESGQEMVLQSATVPAPSLASVAPDVPKAIVEIVDRALAFAPIDRWSSAAEMRDAIAKAHRELYGQLLIPLSRISDPSVRVRPTSRPDLVAQNEHDARAETLVGESGGASVTADAMTAAVTSSSPRSKAPLIAVAVLLAGSAGAATILLVGRHPAAVDAVAIPAAVGSPSVAHADPPSPSVVAAAFAPAPTAAVVLTPVASVAAAADAGARPPTAKTRAAPKAAGAAKTSDWDRQ